MTGTPSKYFSSISNSERPLPYSVVAVAADIAFRLQHVEHAGAQPRARGGDLASCDASAHCGCGSAYRRSDRSLPWSPSLPARLGEPRDHALRAKLAQRNAGHLELAVLGARTARDLAPVTDAGRARVARHFRKLEARRKALLHGLEFVVRDREKTRALAGDTASRAWRRRLFFSIELFFAIWFSWFPRLRADSYCRNGKLNARSKARASSSVLAVVQTMMSMPHTASALS